MAELSPRVNPLFLREEELRQGIELFMFAYRDLMAEADAELDRRGLGRAHHRALYFIGRHPGLGVSDLLSLLGITKQSLSRVVKELSGDGFIAIRPAPPMCGCPSDQTMSNELSLKVISIIDWFTTWMRFSSPSSLALSINLSRKG